MSGITYDDPEVSGRLWSDQESEKVEEIKTAYSITMAKTNHGFSLYVVNIGENISSSILEHGTWDLDATNWLTKNVNESDTCLDIGMNVGYFTELMARKSGVFGRVFSFEANKELVNVYEKTIVESENDYEVTAAINLFDIGLSNETKEAYIFIPNASIDPESEKDQDLTQEGVLSLPVMLDNINNILDEITIEEIDIIRVDLKVNEEDVWDTLEKPLASSRAVMINFYNNISESFLEKILKDFNMFKIESDKEIAISSISKEINDEYVTVILRKK